MNVDWKEMRYIVAAGAVGGLLSWASTLVLPEPDPLEWWKALPLFALLGAGAAPIGVYIVANVDMTAPKRALVFAMLCGFSWKPVFEAGGALLQQQVTRSSDQHVEDNIAQAREAALALSSAEGPEAGEVAVRVAESVFEASRALDEASPAVRRAFEREASSLLQQAASKATDESSKTAVENRIELLGEARALRPEMVRPQFR